MVGPSNHDGNNRGNEVDYKDGDTLEKQLPQHRKDDGQKRGKRTKNKIVDGDHL